MKFLGQGFRKLEHEQDRQTQSERQTDTHRDSCDRMHYQLHLPHMRHSDLDCHISISNIYEVSSALCPALVFVSASEKHHRLLGRACSSLMLLSLLNELHCYTRLTIGTWYTCIIHAMMILQNVTLPEQVL